MGSFFYTIQLLLFYKANIFVPALQRKMTFSDVLPHFEVHSNCNYSGYINVKPDITISEDWERH